MAALDHADESGFVLGQREGYLRVLEWQRGVVQGCRASPRLGDGGLRPCRRVSKETNPLVIRCCMSCLIDVLRVLEDVESVQWSCCWGLSSIHRCSMIDRHCDVAFLLSNESFRMCTFDGYFSESCYDKFGLLEARQGGPPVLRTVWVHRASFLPAKRRVEAARVEDDGAGPLRCGGGLWLLLHSGCCWHSLVTFSRKERKQLTN